MKRSCKNCIWCEDCGASKPCEDFSPIDESADNEAYYINDLRERQETYKEIEQDYI